MDTDNPEPQEMPPADLIEELEWQSLQITTVRAALKLQVWNRIASGPKTAGKIAEENGWDITGTQRLLDALCGMKLLDKDGYEYQLVPIAKAYLIAGTDSYMGDALLAVMNWEGNGELADAIRSGKHLVVNDWTSGGIATFWASQEAPSRLRPEKAIEGKDDIWRLLDVQATEGLRVLDVACGSASMTLALLDEVLVLLAALTVHSGQAGGSGLQNGNNPEKQTAIGLASGLS